MSMDAVMEVCEVDGPPRTSDGFVGLPEGGAFDALRRDPDPPDPAAAKSNRKPSKRKSTSGLSDVPVGSSNSTESWQPPRKHVPSATGDFQPSSTPVALNTPADKVEDLEADLASESPVDAVQSPPLTELEVLVENVKKRVPGAAVELRDYLSKHPEIYQSAGDLFKAAIHSWTCLAGDDSPLHHASVYARAMQTKRDCLRDAGDCPIERILVEQLVVCTTRLEVYCCQEVLSAESNNTKLVKLILSKLESAQLQLHRAIDKLDTFRRLRKEG